MRIIFMFFSITLAVGAFFLTMHFTEPNTSSSVMKIDIPDCAKATTAKGRTIEFCIK